ncbi:MAG: histidinol-phosphate transaminase [Leptospirales bacterium]
MATDYRNHIFKKFKEYIPGEQPESDDWIKLNTNENPFSPSPKVEQKLKELAMCTEAFRKYPNAMGEPLRSALALHYNVEPEQVVVTNGSDEALALLCRIILDAGDRVATPEFTYSLYDTLVSAANGVLEYIPAKNGHMVDLEALAQTDAKMIFFPNPNAPTGEFTSVEKLERAIENSKALWVIDEAYNDFVEQSPDGHKNSFIHKLSKYDNCVVTRTFSKSHALAALRTGYLLSANPYIMSGIRAGKDSYNEDFVALEIGMVALSDETWLHKTTKAVISERKKMQASLENLGFTVLPSQANFVLAEAPKKTTAVNLLEALKQEKILVRHFANSKLDNMLRISIGSTDENSVLIETLKKILRK